MEGGESAAEAGAPATEAASGSTAVEPAASAAPAAAGGGGGGAPARPAAPAYVGPPQPPPRRMRLPLWAMPVVAALPFWALLYAGAYGERGPEEVTPLTLGAAVYSNCSTCHGATGGGGVGPAMDGVLETFPEFSDHVAWVTEGSAAVKGQPYGATGKTATGGMPGFATSLSPEQIIAVVCHERITLAGGEMTPECEAGGEAPTGEADTETNTAGGSGTEENQDASGG